MDYEVNRTFQIDLSVNEVFETAKVIRIDDDHCNPKRIWQEMGAPKDLTPQQVRKIKEQSSLVEKTLNPQIIQGERHMKLELSSNDVILITLE